MKTSVMLLKAVENNIDWCNAVAMSHSLMTVRTDSLWYCTEPMPPFYPNAITRHCQGLDNSQLNDVLAQVEKPWTIKDSFNDFDRADSNLVCLFSAHWYGYQPQPIHPISFDYPSVEFVNTNEDLAQWLEAWGEMPENSVIFNINLLKAGSASLAYLTEFGRITCGAALYTSQGVIGLSNFFGSTEEQQRLIRTIQITFPNETIVGYGDDDELTLLKPFGFVELGKLNVLQTR